MSRESILCKRQSTPNTKRQKRKPNHKQQQKDFCTLNISQCIKHKQCLCDKCHRMDSNGLYIWGGKKKKWSYICGGKKKKNCCMLFLAVCILMIMLCIVDTVMAKYFIRLNPLTFIFDFESLVEINRLHQKFYSGQTFIRNKAGNLLCSDNKYLNNLQNASKMTFLTLLEDSYNLNYLRSALIWCYQINKLHKTAIDVTLMIDINTLKDYDNYHNGDGVVKWFRFLGADNIIILNDNDILHNKNAKKKYWQNIYTKLILFNPNSTNNKYAQIAYFDADNFPLQPMYEIFNMPCNYLLAATNDNYQYDALNAGFLIIRPHKIIYDALLSLYKLEINYYKRGTTEQQMIRDLWNGANRFPYEYNTPYWGVNAPKLSGNYKRQKNIHNKLWKLYSQKSESRILWNKIWNKVWKLLKDNNLTQHMLDLNKCSQHKYYHKNNIDVCYKDAIS